MRLRQENNMLEVNMGHTAGCYLQKTKVKPQLSTAPGMLILSEIKSSMLQLEARPLHLSP